MQWRAVMRSHTHPVPGRLGQQDLTDAATGARPAASTV
jgi:hypothetical protein